MTWNIGGLTAAKLLTTLTDFAGSPELKDINVILVQELITEPGLYHAETDDWQLVFGKIEGEFRGEGIAHHKAYTHHRSKVLTGGVTTQLKHKQTRSIVNALSGHIPHHATIPQTQAILMEWGETLGTSHLLLGMDANETFAPPIAATAGCYAQTGRGDVILEWTAEHNITIPPTTAPPTELPPLQHTDATTAAGLRDARLGTDKSSCARTERHLTTMG